MNIVSSHMFNRSSDVDTAYGCIGGVNLTENNIGVIGATLIVSSPNDSGSYISLSLGNPCKFKTKVYVP